MPGDVAEPSTVPRPARHAWVWLRRVGLVIVAVLALEYVAVRLVAGARQSWDSVGGAAGAALRFRLLVRTGVESGGVLGLTALEYAVTVLWLVIAFLAGLITAVPLPATTPVTRTIALLLVVGGIVLGGLVAVLIARPDRVETVTRALAARLPRARPDAIERILRGFIRQVQLVLDTPTVTRRAALWGMGNWAWDACALYLAVLAFGATPNPGGLVTVYAVAGLVALVPLTPGGLGLVEGVTVPLLVSFGTPHDAALLGVLTWRLFSFWFPVPVALASYLGLRLTVLRPLSGAGRRTAPAPGPAAPGPPRPPARPRPGG